MSETVPERMRGVQTCYFWYHGREPDEDLLSVTRFDQMLVVTCPDCCPDLIARFNRAGGLVFVYVSIYKAPEIGAVPDDLRRWEGGSPFRSSLEKSPFWKAVDLSGHPDWILYDEQDRPRRPFEAEYYMPGWYQTAHASDAYRRAVLDGVRATALDGRFQGLFLDNLHPNRLPSRVRERGAFRSADMADSASRFMDLIPALREAAAEAAGRHVYLVTNGDRNESVQRIADAMVFESFVFSWAWPGRSVDDAQALARLRGPSILHSRGGRSIALPYLGYSGNPIVEDARLIRRLADEAGAIYADFYTLARPELVAHNARRCLERQKPTDPYYYPGVGAALANLKPGDIEAARDIYRLV